MIDAVERDDQRARRTRRAPPPVARLRRQDHRHEQDPRRRRPARRSRRACRAGTRAVSCRPSLEEPAEVVPLRQRPAACRPPRCAACARSSRARTGCPRAPAGEREDAADQDLLDPFGVLAHVSERASEVDVGRAPRRVALSPCPHLASASSAAAYTTSAARGPRGHCRGPRRWHMVACTQEVSHGARDADFLKALGRRAGPAGRARAADARQRRRCSPRRRRARAVGRGALAEAVRRQFGAHLDAAELEEVRQELERNRAAAERLRAAARLANADDPVTRFEARPPRAAAPAGDAVISERRPLLRHPRDRRAAARAPVQRRRARRARLRRLETIGPKLGAVVTLTRERAMREAHRANQELLRRQGPRAAARHPVRREGPGRGEGTPRRAGARCRCASRRLDHDATVDHAARAGGRGAGRQARDGRARRRHGLQQPRRELHRPGPHAVEHGLLERRLLERLGRGGRGRARAVRDRQRDVGLDPHARRRSAA